MLEGGHKKKGMNHIGGMGMGMGMGMGGGFYPW